MAHQQDLGNWAEAQAVDWLLAKGFRVLERNWRFKRAEIDIIAMDGPVMVFVEVKGRTGLGFGDPGERIDNTKKRLIIDAAGAYMRQTGHDWEIRFDIVTVLGGPGIGRHVRHYPDAFFPDLRFPTRRR
jgi:putative endonuclease